jgi:small-conductance mechanosensitive channel
LALLEDQINNEYLRFIVILVGTFIIVTLSYFILKFIVKKVSSGQKSYSKFIFKKVSIPFFALVFITGLYTSINTLNFFNEAFDYYEGINAIFFVVSTLIVALLVSRIITVITMGWLKVRKGFKRTPGLLNKAITVIIFIIAIAVILAYFEIDVTPLIAGVGLGALAIGLALQSTLSNFFAGVHLLSDRPINVGDFIELDENNQGVIEDVGWRSTRIRMLTDNLLIIPNEKLANSNIINYSMPKNDFSIWVPCGVAYESNLKHVEKVCIDVAKKIQNSVPGAVKGFEPKFRYREFGDSNINFITILRIEQPMDRFVVRNEFIKALKERFDKEKIEISWPIRKIYNIK